MSAEGEINVSDTIPRRVRPLPTSAPAFAEVARIVKPPPVREGGWGEFFPAYAGFTIGSGSDVDISYLYMAPGPYSPVRGFDRHLWSEEMFIALEGGVYFLTAHCRDPLDPDALPDPDDFQCWRINEGDVFILKTNVWHGGCWPVDSARTAKLLMVISGHRTSADGGKVDHIWTELADDAPGIVVDVHGQ